MATDRNFEIHGLGLEEVHKKLSEAWVGVNSEVNRMRSPIDGMESAMRYGTRHPLKDRLRIEGMQAVIGALLGQESGLDFWLNPNRTTQTVEGDNSVSLEK